MGLPKGPRVVRSVATHADHMTLALQGGDYPILLFRGDARKDAEFILAEVVGKASGRANGSRYSNLASNGGGSQRGVPR